MAAEAQHVSEILAATLDATKTKQAELALKAEEKKPEYALVLLSICAIPSMPEGTRQAAALRLKNFIRENYADEEGNHRLNPGVVNTVKQELVGLMISVGPRIQAALGDAISEIAQVDFYTRWETLFPELVSRLSPTDAKINNGVLEVAHSICSRWRPAFRSDDLFTEILHVLKIFGGPYMQLLKNTDQQIEANKDNKAVLAQYFETLDLLMKLYYDLSCQDLPEIFEDNLKEISSTLYKYLTYDNPLLHSDTDSEVGPIESVKAGICEVLVLYVQKYEDAFGPLLGDFIQSVWTLLTTLGPETKYDILVSKALQFLTAVAGHKTHAEKFHDEATFKQIVEKVILPNVSLRESDVEQFEDEPIEYIRRDLEGSDSDTRRRAATEFLQKLLDQFPEFTTQIVGVYVESYLKLFADNPKDQWQAKDTAVYLYSSIAARGSVTANYGVTQVNPLTNVVEFFSQHISSDLAVDAKTEPILKVDAIKFLYMFRRTLTKEQWKLAFPPLLENLQSTNYVVYTYTAIAVERLLFLTDDSGQHVFGKDDIGSYAKPLLEYLFQLIERPGAPEKVQENEFLIRCAMRILIVIREDVVPLTDMVMEHLIKITKVMMQNPSNPNFQYYHFEAFGALIRYAAPVFPDKLEKMLYEPFAAILIEDVTEFKPYVFQLFAALLEARPSGPLPDYYKQLIAPVLDASLWETKGNIPALSRLLTSMVPRAAADIASNKEQLQRILMIFQDLLTGRFRKTSEPYAFDIIDCLVVSFPLAVYNEFFSPILSIIFTRLSQNPTEVLKRRVTLFYHLVSARAAPVPANKNFDPLGADFFIQETDKLDNTAFTKLYLTIILPTTATLTKPIDRKLAVISLTKTVTDSTMFAQRYASKGWMLTCNMLLNLLANPPKVEDTRGEHVVEADVDDVAFGAGYTALNTCRRRDRDDWVEVDDVQRWVGKALMEGEQRSGRRVGEFIKTKLEEEQRQMVIRYMSTAA